jgi:hypothetical protein
MKTLVIKDERTLNDRPVCSWVGCGAEAKMIRTVAGQGYPVCVKHFQESAPTPPIVKEKKDRPQPRNSLCLCGSGKKAKHCHPDLTPAAKIREQERKRKNLANKLLGREPK